MLSFFLLGWKTLEIDAPYGAEALDLCRAYGLVYDRVKPTADGGLSLRMRAVTARKMLSFCRGKDLPVRVIAEGGLPRFAGKLFRRPGLCLGLLLAAVMTVLSTTVVWDVRVSGNTTLSERAVEESLSACGFGVGKLLWGFKADQLQNRVLMTDKRLAWISVNMRGTVAYVEVREAVYPEDTHDKDTPANLVARMGGQIVRVELIRGNVLVSAGQWVGEGDLLVSGLYDSEQVGMRYTHAEAKVYARTTQNMTVEIPLAHEVKVYAHPADAVLLQKDLIFFGKSIKFSNKTRNEGEFCDTIESVYVPFTDTGVGFPIALRQVWALPYTLTQETYTYAEAEELAYLELARQISEIPGGAEVLSKTVTVTRTPTSLLLQCNLTCVQDIAQEKLFEVER